MEEKHSTFIKLFPILLLAAILYSYRNLLQRPFAADDYEWLLNVRGLDLGGVVLRAFDPGVQHHFYRPLIWLLIWAEYHLFGQNPIPYHIVSLGLHFSNVCLLMWLAMSVKQGRGDQRKLRPAEAQTRRRVHIGRKVSRVASFRVSVRNLMVSRHNRRLGGCRHAHAELWLLPLLVFALHPAPFEAVVWISAQSELLGALLLLLTLNLWQAERPWTALISLVLALLSKESAIIALLFMPLLRPAWRQLLPHAFLGIGYLILQAFVGQRNSVLRAGEYGIGTHMLSNPLRSLALLFAPLPNSEHADAAWLVTVGAMLALLLAAVGLYALLNGGKSWRWVLCLALSLAPTAPFLSAPDSRYLYVPVAILALGLGYWIKEFFRGASPQTSLLSVIILILVLIYSSGELAAREERFATASGPGASLWQLASKICADVQPEHMLLVDAPIATAHATAIVQLSCARTQPLLIGRDQLSSALRPASVVISFPGGRAEVEAWH